MEDLFGHNRKRHMPLTAEIEDHIYQTRDEENSYRGIKDMDFGIESEVQLINSAGFSQARTGPMSTMRDFVPNPEGYFMETLHHTLNDIRPIDSALVQRLTLLNDEQYTALVAKLPEGAANVTAETIKVYGEMLRTLHTLAETALPEAIRVYRAIVAEGYDWSIQHTDFTRAEYLTVSLLDSVKVCQVKINSDFHGSMEPTDSKMSKEEWEAAAKKLVTDILPNAYNVPQSMLSIMGQLNILVGECIRVNKLYHEVESDKRPAYTSLKRFAATIENVTSVLDTVVYTQRSVFQFLEVLIGRNK